MIGIMTDTTTTGRWSSRITAAKAKADRGLRPTQEWPRKGPFSFFKLLNEGSVPRRRKARIDAAAVLRQSGNRLPILIVETDIQRIEIGLLALLVRGLRDRRYTILI